MATKKIPTLPQADVEAHKTAESCYVTIGTKVFDITDFLDDHPGGAELILEYGGKDVKAIMEDEDSHKHSEAAYEVLDDSFIGFVAHEGVMNAVVESDHPDQIVPLPATGEGLVDLNGRQVYAATGMSSAEDLSKETDMSADFKKHKFLDLNKPLLPQMWTGGFSKEFYLEQVHRPRHYKGGESAPLFGNFLEPLSKTPWWVVPTVWLPPVAYGTILAGVNLPALWQLPLYWLTGLGIWTIVEYGLHRCLFHVDQYVIPCSTSF